MHVRHLITGVLAAWFASDLAPPASALPTAAPAALQAVDEELQALLAEERAEAQRLIDGARFSEAKRLLDEHLDEDPDDWRARALRGRLELARANYDKARRDLTAALTVAPPEVSDVERSAAVLDLAELELTLGATEAALVHLESGGAAAPPAARRDFLRGQALLERGDLEAARTAFRAPAGRAAEDAATADRAWVEPYYRARCERALGQLSAASFNLVTADKLANNRSADVLAELASVYFEADGEVALAGSAARRPADLYREALELAPGHPASLLGMYALHDLNWRRSSRSARSWIVELTQSQRNHVEGLVTLTRDQLQNGEFKGARATLGRLFELAEPRRDVQALRATLDWVTDEVEAADARFAALAESAPWDSEPELLAGEMLISLYRFGDALGFLESAVERAPGDWRAWRALGEARSNTGDEVGGLAALGRAKDAAEGRQDAWRNNLTLVLEKMDRRWIEIEGPGRLTYALPPEGHELLERVLAPFYFESRADLASRYGLTPGPVRIEVFDKHADFSVRSTGFEGFPALGVCFGAVVTALSPLCEIRGNFSWAETSYHEFSHVVHLELTRNRCPRWITEGLATWEEERQNPAWTRNMRRELIDCLATDTVIGVRDLNRAFRGPRIIWAYYQGGLMCELLIDRYGFPAMVDFLEAFNDGLELDAALDRSYGLTPEQLDADFLAFLRDYTADLHVEPQHDPAALAVQAFTLPKSPPDQGVEEWVSAWCDVAWSAWQDDRSVDAEGALRHLTLANLEHPRAEFLRAQMALAVDARDVAVEHFERGFALGGRDYIASMTRGLLAEQADELDVALQHFVQAEQVFPGWSDPGFSAELAQARTLKAQGQNDAAMLARERYVRWDSGDAQTRLEVGAWRLARGTVEDWERALQHYTEAIEVDPFMVIAHRGRGDALMALERFDEAVEAFELALLVPLELDPQWFQASEEARANLRAELQGRFDEARKASSEG